MQLRMRDISIERVIALLEQLGGKCTAASADRAQVVGTGWQAQLRQQRARLGTFHLREVLVEFQGPADLVDQVITRLRKLSLRAGG